MPRLRSVLVFAVGTLVACKGGGAARTCDEASTAPECLPPAHTMHPPGAAAPPTVEDAVSRLASVESGSATVGATGGFLTLSGGFRLDVPAGALPPGTVVWVHRYLADEGVWATVSSFYRVVSPVQPSAPVAITFPIPTGGGIDPGRVYVVHHPLGGGDPEGLTGAVDAAAGTVTVAAASFSTFVPTNDTAVPQTLVAERVLQVPYYSQSGTTHCWSTAMLMLITAYGLNVEPGYTSTFFGLADEHGLSFWAFQYGADIIQYLNAAIPGVPIERRTWYVGGSATPLRAYLHHTLEARRPVMAFLYTPEPHMVLFVGYDPVGFWFHDPATRGYSYHRWEDLLAMLAPPGAGAFAGTGTLAFGYPMPTTEWDATVMVPFPVDREHGVWFYLEDPTTGTFIDEGTGALEWDTPAAIVNPETGAFVRISRHHHIKAHVAVASIVPRGPPATIAVGVEITDHDGNVVYHHPTVAATLTGGESEIVDLTPGRARGLPFLETGITEPGLYTATLYAQVGGARHDTAQFEIAVTHYIDERLDCPALTTEYRADCPEGFHCWCVGNAFCEGFLLNHEGYYDCDSAQLDCAGHCDFFFDPADPCDCARYCAMFTDTLGCERLNCSMPAERFREECSEGYDCSCIGESFCEEVLAAEGHYVSCERVDELCAARCQSAPADCLCGTFCGWLRRYLGCG